MQPSLASTLALKTNSKCHKLPPDGNCLYNSISVLLEGEEDLAERLRRRIFCDLANERAKYETWISSGVGVAEYIKLLEDALSLGEDQSTFSPLPRSFSEISQKAKESKRWPTGSKGGKESDGMDSIADQKATERKKIDLRRYSSRGR